jgi:hypothetical protein
MPVAIFLIDCLLIASAVLMHYEMLHLLTLWIPKLAIRHRYRIVVGVFGSLIAHVCEIALFAFGYFMMVHHGGFGAFSGNFDGSFADCLYFSITAYTSLGFGDIEPFGALRLLSGFEALTGLVLITWTASFMFVEMRRFWDS